MLYARGKFPGKGRHRACGRFRRVLRAGEVLIWDGLEKAVVEGSEGLAALPAGLDDATSLYTLADEQRADVGKDAAVNTPPSTI